MHEEVGKWSCSGKNASKASSFALHVDNNVIRHQKELGWRTRLDMADIQS